jgi:hypothetical protein
MFLEIFHQNKRNFIKDIKKLNRDVQFSPIDDGDITFVKGDDIELRLEYEPCSFMEKLEKKYLKIEILKL